MRSTAVNQANQPVFSWVRWVMVHKRDSDSPAPETVIPELPSFVAPENLSVPAYFSTKNYDASATGGKYFWEDYAVNERLNHTASMLINDSDHSLATRLYQNNAKLHFNNNLSSIIDGNFQKPIVYGGVIISLCRALSFDGLENAIAILAINSGTHLKLSVAGDTILTTTEVLDIWELPNRSDVGALRLRMIGLNNKPIAPEDNVPTKTGHMPNVVLDLDYTVLMPRKGKQ